MYLVESLVACKSLSGASCGVGLGGGWTGEQSGAGAPEPLEVWAFVPIGAPTAAPPASWL